GTQDAEALTALATKYPGFQEAYAQGKVVHHALVARSDAPAQADTFELVSASAERHQAFGYAFMVTEATNQWTGAAFEALGGVRVHFAPFQAQRTTAWERNFRTECGGVREDVPLGGCVSFGQQVRCDERHEKRGALAVSLRKYRL
ncbi:MAG TPA: hypothetical protein VEY13_07300, partial [Rubrobacteraceae bacterium]|nr:hypothetical protein [Rubrobacteraceae bacterium]